MKLSQKTISVIKTFATINSNLLIEPGKRIRTISVAKNIIAEAQIDEELPQEFGIYNTSELLGALSLFKEPDVTFSEKYITIRDGQNTGISLKYVGAAKDILVYPTKEVKMPAFDITFDLSEVQLSNVIKAASVIGAPDVLVKASADGITLVVCDKKNPSSNDFQLVVCDKEYNEASFALKIENLKLYPGDNTVSISGKGLSQWKNTAAGVTTCIALEAA